jgi:hypothetical protein
MFRDATWRDLIAGGIFVVIVWLVIVELAIIGASV